MKIKKILSKRLLRFFYRLIKKENEMKRGDILKELAEAKSRIEFLEKELKKPNKIEFRYEKNNTYVITEVDVNDKWSVISKILLNNFRYRQTKTNAEADLMLQKELMCIGTLAEQIYPEYKSDIIWEDMDSKYFIIFNTHSNKYIVGKSNYYRTLGVVYMPEDVAEKVCEILNNNRVKIN